MLWTRVCVQRKLSTNSTSSKITFSYRSKESRLKLERPLYVRSTKIALVKLLQVECATIEIEDETLGEFTLQLLQMQSCSLLERLQWKERSTSRHNPSVRVIRKKKGNATIRSFARLPYLKKNNIRIGSTGSIRGSKGQDPDAERPIAISSSICERVGRDVAYRYIRSFHSRV